MDRLANSMDPEQSDLDPHYLHMHFSPKIYAFNDKLLVFLFQVVPIPVDCVQEVKDTFMECAESDSLELNEIPKHSDIRQVRIASLKTYEQIGT